MKNNTSRRMEGVAMPQPVLDLTLSNFLELFHV
jgi:hypothetical protein